MLKIVYDPNKAKSNLIKHGVDFEDAKRALFDPNALVTEDNDHNEPQFVLIGMANRLLVVVYCYVDCDDIIRIISARIPTKKERKFYESGI
ncbi:MAG: BrnT family toxin [Acinetobacter sp.]|nr:BrnT family toxin [Acinetobacter sp.]